MHAVVACGVAVAAAVICGALIVGDSMRGSLRRLTLDRLGRVELALVADRFFRAELADELACDAGLERQSAARCAGDLDPDQRGTSGGFRVQGSGRLDSNRPDPQSAESLSPRQPRQPDRLRQPLLALGKWPPVPAHPPGDGQIVLNRPLAEALGVSVGQRVSVRIPRVGGISIDSPLGRSATPGRSEVLTVSAVIQAEGLGGFSLRPNQRQPQNAYVPLDWLSDRLGPAGQPPDRREPGRNEGQCHPGRRPAGRRGAGARPTADPSRLAPHAGRLWHPRAKDCRGYWNVTSDRMILEPAVEEALSKARSTRWKRSGRDPLGAQTPWTRGRSCGPQSPAGVDLPGQHDRLRQDGNPLFDGNGRGFRRPSAAGSHAHARGQAHRAAGRRRQGSLPRSCSTPGPPSISTPNRATRSAWITSSRRALRARSASGPASFGLRRSSP